MGVVFVADQTEPVQRRVALKIIRAGLDTHRMMARFEQERQALALMDHPNIAKVFDAGMVGPVCRTGPEAGAVEGPARQAGPSGQPYFAMELVKDELLTGAAPFSRSAERVIVCSMSVQNNPLRRAKLAEGGKVRGRVEECKIIRCAEPSSPGAVSNDTGRGTG